MFKEVKKVINWGGKVIELSTGKIARQASGSCMVKIGETVVLCTVVAEREPKHGIDFFPLTVNYLERFYAIGSIPGGFFKRESKPSERETLTSRLIDRPMRPMFPDGFRNEVQIVCTVLAFDKSNESDIAALIGASAAVAISGIPFVEPIAAARVGYINGEYVLNPTVAEMESSTLDLVVAGTKSSVLMVESEAQQLSEEVMLGAVVFGQESFAHIIEEIKALAEEVGNQPWQVEMFDDSEIVGSLEGMVGDKLDQAYTIKEKSIRRDKLKALKDQAVEALPALEASKVASAFKGLEKKIVRSRILKHNDRIDGRKLDEIRNIVCEVDVLPRVHSSALFTRGETQALVVTTLGTGNDGQMVDDISGGRTETFMLHYNFPPYSVGEVGPMRAPGRREIGHGKLAYRSIKPVMPSYEEFPYIVRIVSEITESNGSSSMATVCGTSLSLMACGVNLKAPVAGIAMGLVKEGDDYAVLSDIMGDEDHLGDMDFKVAGTAAGITALQMDIKINGISKEIITVALEQAKNGRTHILNKMSEVIVSARTSLNANAPKILTVQIEKDKIRELIGPGGKMIKSICEKSQAKIEISDDGLVRIAAANDEQAAIAMAMVRDITAVPEVGKIYNGIITKITDFGAFVRYLGNAEGLVHISEIVDHKLAKVTDVVQEAASVIVKLIGVERNGKVRLSMKGLNPDLVDSSVNDASKEAATVVGEERVAESKSPSLEAAAARRKKPRPSKPKGERLSPERKSEPSSEAAEVTKKKRRLF
jgi:polyribonucleotide nucleotidyltransferase